MCVCEIVTSILPKRWQVQEGDATPPGILHIPKGNTQCQAGRLKSAHLHVRTHKHMPSCPKSSSVCFPYFPGNCSLTHSDFKRYMTISICVCCVIYWGSKVHSLFRDIEAICEPLHFNYKAMLMSLGNLFRWEAWRKQGDNITAAASSIWQRKAGLVCNNVWFKAILRLRTTKPWFLRGNLAHIALWKLCQATQSVPGFGNEGGFGSVLYIHKVKECLICSAASSQCTCSGCL